MAKLITTLNEVIPMVGVVLPVLVVASNLVFVSGMTVLINNLLLYCLRCVLLAKYRTS